MWAQGSCELPTAKPRKRRSLPPLRGAFLNHDLPIGRPLPSKSTTISPRVQATRVGTSQLKPTNYSLVPGSLEEWCPRGLLPTSSRRQGDPRSQMTSGSGDPARTSSEIRWEREYPSTATLQHASRTPAFTNRTLDRFLPLLSRSPRLSEPRRYRSHGSAKRDVGWSLRGGASSHRASKRGLWSGCWSMSRPPAGSVILRFYQPLRMKQR